MTEQELRTLIASRIAANTADGGGLFFADSLPAPDAAGVRATISPTLSNPEPFSIGAWMIVIGDRDGNRGLASFQADGVETLLQNATAVVVDTAKPWRRAYCFFAELVNWGARVVVIQTITSRRLVWLALVHENSPHPEICELLPCGAASLRPAKLTLTELVQTE